MNFNFVKRISDFEYEYINEYYNHNKTLSLYNDLNLKFSDLFDIVEKVCSGEITPKSNIKEKTKEQHVFITYVDGQIKIARNKEQILKPLHLDVFYLKPGYSDINNSFIYAMKDLQYTIQNIKSEDRDFIFNNGKNFIQVEVIYPLSSNVIKNDKHAIIFHKILVYNKNGEFVNFLKNGNIKVVELIKSMLDSNKFSASVLNFFNIVIPDVLYDVSNENQVFKDFFNNSLKNIMESKKLNKDNTIGDYVYNVFKELIISNFEKYNYTDRSVVNLLALKWSKKDNKLKISSIIKNIHNNSRLTNWIVSFNKSQSNFVYNKSLYVMQLFSIKLCLEILRHSKVFITSVTEDNKKVICNDILSKEIELNDSGNIKNIESFKKDYINMLDLGGLECVYPKEGVIFKYKNKKYKINNLYRFINTLLLI